MKRKKLEYRTNMTLDEKLNALRQFPLLSTLSDQILKDLASFTTEKFIPENTVFIDQGSVADVVFLLISGSVKVYRVSEDGKEVVLAILGPGELVGEMALIDHLPRSAYVESIQYTTTLCFSSANFLNLITIYPTVAMSLLTHLSNKLRSTGELLESISTTSVCDRTWKTLIILKYYFPNEEIALSHEELALLIGATRARITEALDTLQKSGKIKLNHRNITLL